MEDGGRQTTSRPDLLHLYQMGLSVTTVRYRELALSFLHRRDGSFAVGHKSVKGGQGPQGERTDVANEFGCVDE